MSSRGGLRMSDLPDELIQRFVDQGRQLMTEELKQEVSWYASRENLTFDQALVKLIKDKMAQLKTELEHENRN